MNYETLMYEKCDMVAKITLNRPERLNALDSKLIMEIPQAVGEAGSDDDIRVVVLTGAGRAFCAGADFRYSEVREGTIAPEVAEEPRAATAGRNIDQGYVLYPFVGEAILGLQRMGKPTIAMVNGAAVGGGFELALACDIRIGSDKARFRMVFTTIGITPGAGGPWTLPRIVGLSKACKIIFSGDFVEAEEAYRIGLLDDLVPAERLEEETMAFARRLAEGPPIALRLDKMMIYKGLETDLETALAFQTACQNISLHSEDHTEGIKAFAEKRKPVFRGT
jgi:enoyl-CoA hydratase/carnithine racemase